MLFKYTVWAGDLNSLYNKVPNAPVAAAKGLSLKQAQILKGELQDADTSVWIEREPIFPAWMFKWLTWFRRNK